MSVPQGTPFTSFGSGLRVVGVPMVVNGVTVRPLGFDADFNITSCDGATVPTDGSATCAKGCFFTKTNGGVATTKYINEGSATTCDFNAIESSASTITGVTASNGLIGGGTEGTVTLAVGQAVYNNTGSPLTPGTLVRLAGFTSTLGVTVALADADANLPATHVVVTTIADATAGTVYPAATVTGLATNGQTIGDAVYLSGTAGGFTFSAPAGANQYRQIVGFVKVVNASTGEIVFNLNNLNSNKFGTDQLQAAAVTGAKLSTAVGYFTVAKDTNSTTPVNVIAATVPFSCVITGVYLISKDTTASNITLADTAGTVATIAKGTTAGELVGATSLANTTVTAGNTLTIVSSGAGEATVFITFTVA